MLKVLLVILAAVRGSQQCDAATMQLPNFKNRTTGPIGTLTTCAGAPVEYNEATSTLNTNLLSNEHLMDDLTNFVRTRIIERVVHASGTGASGYYEATNDLTHISKAKIFQKDGNQIPITCRFSLGFSRSGIKDTSRESRGFACKFYTEEGNLDLATLSSQIFPFKDPLLAGALRAAQLNPASNLPDPNMLWDFLSLNPETLYFILHLFSDYGTPVSYSHMPGHAVHTFQVYNEQGNSSYVRFHFIPEAGTKNFNSTQAAAAGSDLNYYARTLYNAIADGQYPSWSLKLQVLSEEDVDNAGFDVFDVTNDLPTDDYPYIEAGKFTLNRNPVNHHAEIEQLAISPGNLIPGILTALDAIYNVRRFVYRDSHNTRLSGNSKNIPVNSPLKTKAFTYTRDGMPPVNANGADGPNYYPNSYNGPTPWVEENRPAVRQIIEKASNNYELANKFYTNVLTSEERSNLVDNLLESLCTCETFLQERAVEGFKKINSTLAALLTEGLANCASQC